MSGFWAGGLNAYSKATDREQRKQLKELTRRESEAVSDDQRTALRDSIEALRSEIHEERRNRKNLIF